MASDDDLTLLRPKIRLTGGQLKSLAAAQDVAKGLDLIESTWGIHSVNITLADCFICRDVDWRELNSTPIERLLRDIIMDIEYQKSKINGPPWEPPFCYLEPDEDPA